MGKEYCGSELQLLSPTCHGNT